MIREIKRKMLSQELKAQTGNKRKRCLIVAMIRFFEISDAEKTEFIEFIQSASEVKIEAIYTDLIDTIETLEIKGINYGK